MESQKVSFDLLHQIIHSVFIYFVIIQQVSDLYSGTSRRFGTSDAVLRNGYQGPCPLYASAFQLCIPPYLIYTIYAKFLISHGSGAFLFTIIPLIAFGFL